VEGGPCPGARPPLNERDPGGRTSHVTTSPPAGQPPPRTPVTGARPCPRCCRRARGDRAGGGGSAREDGLTPRVEGPTVGPRAVVRRRPHPPVVPAAGFAALNRRVAGGQQGRHTPGRLLLAVVVDRAGLSRRRDDRSMRRAANAVGRNGPPVYRSRMPKRRSSGVGRPEMRTGAVRPGSPRPAGGDHLAERVVPRTIRRPSERAERPSGGSRVRKRRSRAVAPTWRRISPRTATSLPHDRLPIARDVRWLAGSAARGRGRAFRRGPVAPRHRATVSRSSGASTGRANPDGRRERDGRIRRGRARRFG